MMKTQIDTAIIFLSEIFHENLLFSFPNPDLSYRPSNQTHVWQSNRSVICP